MGFTFNDFMHQVVAPIEKGITSPFTQASSDLKKTSSTITHSFDNVVNKGAGALDGLFNSLSNPLLIIGIGAVAFFVITKK